MINKHGLKMNGLKKASSETKNLNGYYSGRYIQISYDKSTGEVLTDFHCSIGQNSWTEYHDPNIVRICNASDPMTMQQIADLVANTIRA